MRLSMRLFGVTARCLPWRDFVDPVGSCVFIAAFVFTSSFRSSFTMFFMPQSSDLAVSSSNATSFMPIPSTKPTPSALSSIPMQTSFGEVDNGYAAEDQFVINDVNNVPWWVSKYSKRQKEKRDITYTTVTITITESSSEPTSTGTITETITTHPADGTSTVTQTIIPPGEVTTVWVTKTAGAGTSSYSVRLSSVLLASLVMSSVIAWL